MDSDFLLCGFTRAIFGEAMSRGGIFFASFYDQAWRIVGLQSAGMVNLWKENEAKSVLQNLQRQ
jgi:hypothetical protein